MVTRVLPYKFVEFGRSIPILDVRSPGEFSKGHIPNALNFPLFDDTERAEIGTLYKRAGQLKAMQRGMAIVGTKMEVMFAEGLASAKDGKLLVHCWRGGKRSEAVANLLSMAGIEVYLLEGGYKAFRNWVLEQFESDFDIRVIGGMTGTGKTKVLQALASAGAQILDLEGHARHRGSAFGRIGMGDEVTAQQFENEMAFRLTQMASGPIWVEDESRMLGDLVIPAPLWVQMRAAQVYAIRLPLEVRMDLLMEDYGDFPVEDLRKSVERIAQRLGGLRTKIVLDALEKEEHRVVMEELLVYYDKKYSHGQAKRDAGQISYRDYEKFDAEEIAAELMAE